MKIAEQFTIIEKEVGWYHAFPTLACKDGIIWLACRSGKVEKRQCHGSKGSVRSGKNWQRIGSPAHYKGSIYDGGYGDVIQLERNRFLAVYYLCDQDASPWIEGTIFSLDQSLL